MTTQVSKKELLALEHRFWDAIQKKDGKTAAKMTAPESVLVGAQGVSIIGPELMDQLTVEAKWEVKSYDFDDKSVQIKMLDDSTALIAYNVTEELVVDGKPLRLEANDSSVWRRNGGDWMCVLHTESPAGDPFARDRK